MRVGIIALLTGFVGGTFAFIRESSKRRMVSKKGLFLLYLSKICGSFIAAYLAILVLPIFGLGVSTEVEQAVAILAAVLGGDFIGLLIRRVFGELPVAESWSGKERRMDALMEPSDGDTGK